MYSLLMCLTEQEESQILISDEIMTQIDWKIQIGIIIKHIDILPSDKIPRIRKYLGRFAYWLLETQNDIWAFITLNLIIGNWSTSNVYENPNFKDIEQCKTNLRLNYICTLLEKLTCVPDMNKPTPILLELTL